MSMLTGAPDRPAGSYTFLRTLAGFALLSYYLVPYIRMTTSGDMGAVSSVYS